VGENGSGKTTLAKLLGALYVPTAGAVLWDGVNTADADRDALRADAAVIFQDFVRYALPARDNIVLGRHERRDDDDAIRAAACRAGAHADIEPLATATTPCWDRRSRAAPTSRTGSGNGWRSRACSIRHAPFVILDEPTAALDARAEA
jgi:ATP-binding cassette subfamily B protein